MLKKWKKKDDNRSANHYIRLGIEPMTFEFLLSTKLKVVGSIPGFMLWFAHALRSISFFFRIFLNLVWDSIYNEPIFMSKHKILSKEWNVVTVQSAYCSALLLEPFLEPQMHMNQQKFWQNVCLRFCFQYERGLRCKKCFYLFRNLENILKFAKKIW